MKTYYGNIVPEPNTIFVFGSNPTGIHGAGSAKIAVTYFGAKYGQGEGLQGNAYALPTTILFKNNNDKYNKEFMTLEDITENVRTMYNCARENPNLNFKVAYRNKPNEVTLCGYSGKELQKCFKDAGPIPENVWFSKEWIDSGNLN